MSRRPDEGREAAARVLDLVGQVQDFGLASAAAVAERYIDTVDRYLAARVMPAEGVADGLGGRPPRRRGPKAGETITLPAVRAGACSRASVWVHNPTAEPVRVTLRVSGLTSADGHALPAEAVVVQPVGTTAAHEAGCAQVDPGGAAEVVLLVRVPARMPPGHFHGVVTSTATPRQAIPVVLQVLPGEGPA